MFLLFDLRQDAKAGAEAMRGSILADCDLALGGLGAGGLLCIAPIGRDLFGSGHKRCRKRVGDCQAAGRAQVRVRLPVHPKHHFLVRVCGRGVRGGSFRGAEAIGTEES